MLSRRISSIYKKKSHKKLKLVTELLYTQYQRSKDKYMSASELAKKIKKDLSGVNAALKKLKQDGIVDFKYPEKKESKTQKGWKIKTLYKLNKKAYEIIKIMQTKTAE